MQIILTIKKTSMKKKKNYINEKKVNFQFINF